MSNYEQIRFYKNSLKGTKYSSVIDELFEIGNEYNQRAIPFAEEITEYNNNLDKGIVTDVKDIVKKSRDIRTIYENYREKEQEAEKYEGELRNLQRLTAIELGKNPDTYHDNEIISRPNLNGVILPFNKNSYGFDFDIVNPFSRDYQMCIRELSALRGESVEETEKVLNDSLRLGTIGDYERTFKKLYKEEITDNILALDIETNSLSPAQGNIIEFGCIDINGNRYDELFNPTERNYDANGMGLTSIHHITESMVFGKKSFETESKNILDMMRGKTLLVHNKNFELNWFRQQIEGFEEAEEKGLIRTVDTMHICQKFCPTKKNTLQAFVEYTGGEYKDAHRSSTDAQMTLDALVRWQKM